MFLMCDFWSRNVYGAINSKKDIFSGIVIDCNYFYLVSLEVDKNSLSWTELLLRFELLGISVGRELNS